MISEWQLMIQAQASASKSATIEYFRVFGSFFTTQYLPITWGAGLKELTARKSRSRKISLPKFNSVSSTHFRAVSAGTVTKNRDSST